MDDNDFEQETPVDYEIGYRRPPKDTQFKKGVSGNPKGRPKKPVNFREQFLREARLPVVINENGRTIRISKHDVALRQLMHKAMKGDGNALKLFLRYYEELSEQASLLAEQRAKDAENEKRKNYKELSTAELEWLVAQQYEEAQLRVKEQKIEPTE